MSIFSFFLILPTITSARRFIIITPHSITTARKYHSITTGSKVRVKAGAKTYSGGSLASFVYSRDHIVKELSGKRAVITYGGTVVAAVKLLDFTDSFHTHNPPYDPNHSGRAVIALSESGTH